MHRINQVRFGPMSFIVSDRAFLQGAQLGQVEATGTFFAMAKLSQSKDVRERKKETLFTLDLSFLVDVTLNNVSDDQRAVSCGHWYDHRHFQFETRYDQPFGLLRYFTLVGSSDTVKSRDHHALGLLYPSR